MDLFGESAKILEEENIQYASKLPYHQMCRWNSGMFYKHPALESYRYYWRIEPKVQFFCNVDYDVFRYMEDNNKTYGFTINLYDAPQTIKTLWPETKKFMAANPSYLSESNMLEWITDDQVRPEHTQGANGYSTCHFWSNFEIGDMDFFRGEKYEAYFQHLDRAGGFFYERWGDAPVHSLGIGLFADSNNVHWCVISCPLMLLLPLTVRVQVPRHWLQSHPLLQLPELAQVFRLHPRQVLRRCRFPGQGGLSADILQVRRHTLSHRHGNEQSCHFMNLHHLRIPD